MHRFIVRNLELPYPLLLDEGAKIFRQYNLRAYPTTLVIDQKGSLRLIRFGCSPAIMKQIAMKIESLLATETPQRHDERPIYDSIYNNISSEREIAL